DVYNAVTYAGSFMSIIDTQVTLVSVRVSYGTDGAADLGFVQPSPAGGGAAGSWSDVHTRVAAAGRRRRRGSHHGRPADGSQQCHGGAQDPAGDSIDADGPAAQPRSYADGSPSPLTGTRLQH